MHGTAKVEVDRPVRELVGDRAGVGERARESIQRGDDERVAVAACHERLTEPRSLAIGAGQAVVDIDATSGHTEFGRGVALSSEILQQAAGGPGAVVTSSQ